MVECLCSADDSGEGCADLAERDQDMDAGCNDVGFRAYTEFNGARVRFSSCAIGTRNSQGKGTSKMKVKCRGWVSAFALLGIITTSISSKSVDAQQEVSAFAVAPSFNPRYWHCH